MTFMEFKCIGHNFVKLNKVVYVVDVVYSLCSTIKILKINNYEILYFIIDCHKTTVIFYNTSYFSVLPRNKA